MNRKAYMEQVFDCMKWNYLSAILNRLAFILINSLSGLIEGYILNPSFSILINGAPSSWFTFNIGLLQGFPLCPLLFKLCSEMESSHLHEVVRTGAWDLTN